jgi:3-hydroxybutyryl-CoA dehydrogenase
MPKVAVIGSGLMGSGIAQVAAQAGWQVALRDVTDAALASARDAIEGSYRRFVAKGTLAEQDAEASLARIATTTDLAVAADAEVVV